MTYICGCSVHDQDCHCPAHWAWEEWSGCWLGLDAELNTNPLISFKYIMIHYLRQDPISGAWRKLCERQAEVGWSKLRPRQHERASQPTASGFCKGRQLQFDCWGWLEGNLDVFLFFFFPIVLPSQIISHVNPTQQGITKGFWLPSTPGKLTSFSLKASKVWQTRSKTLA